MTKISTKTPLRYPGGKSRAIKNLTASLPQGTQIRKVGSPFFGGGSFELSLAGQNIAVQGADAFHVLVTFWKALADAPTDLADRLTHTHTTGVGKDVFRALQGLLREAEDAGDKDMLEVAHAFFIVNRCSFSGATLSGGYSAAADTGRFTLNSIRKVREWHNPLLSVTEMDFKDSIPAWQRDESIDLLFVDPPYMLGGSRDSLYGNKGNKHNGFDHGALRDILLGTDKPFLLTYNDDASVRDMYKNCHLTPSTWAYGMNASKKSSELFITNYALDAIPQTPV